MAGSAASNPWRKAKKSGELPITSVTDNFDDFKDMGSDGLTMKQTRNYNSKTQVAQLKLDTPTAASMHSAYRME